MTGIPKGPNIHHSIDLGDGRVISGRKSLDLMQRQSDKCFKYGVAGKTVLDIGAWDGGFSFEAERRGARRVLATDHFCWNGPGPGTRAAFDYAHAALNSNVETAEVDVFDLTPEKFGTFDVVLFLGVLYHLRDPLGGLQILRDMTAGHAVIETQATLLDDPRPLLRFYLGVELNNDPTNFFVPNPAGLENMLLEVGFRRVELSVPANMPPGASARIFAHAFV